MAVRDGLASYGERRHRCASRGRVLSRGPARQRGGRVRRRIHRDHTAPPPGIHPLKRARDAQRYARASRDRPAGGRVRARFDASERSAGPREPNRGALDRHSLRPWRNARIDCPGLDDSQCVATINPTPETEDAMKVEPYLFFDGRCEEALNFYRRVLGAEVLMLMRFKDSPEPPQPGMVPPGSENKVMHASFRIGETVVMASDGHCKGQPKFDGFSLSLTVPNEAEAERLFAALADGGQVRAPLAKTFFSPRFGMLADRFGVSWMIIAEPK